MIFRYIIAIIMFPLVFLIMLPIEVPLWREYKRQGYNVPGYLKFFWRRCMIMKEDDYKKIEYSDED